MKPWFYLFAFWSSTLVHGQQCRIGGQVFFADAVDRTITVKTDSGDLVNFSYDHGTSFVRAGSRSEAVPPEALNTGDRLCVGTSEPPMVTVTPRREIDAEQKKELAAWQGDSLYGVVAGVNREARRITLAVSAGDKTATHSIDVSSNAAYWVFPHDTIRLRDAVPGSLDRVATGDTLYVRGTKRGASQTFAASLIVSGGFRSFAATIESMEILDEQMHVRLILSGRRQKVHVNLGELYTIGRVGAATSEARRLYRISAGDLQPGDTVLILGIGEGTESLRACALIAGFSPFGSLPPDPGQQLRWIFDNVPLGDSYSEPDPTVKNEP
jgi:hypothetical protein